MAKKKDVECEISLTDFSSRIKAEITKEYGKGVCISGQNVLDRKLKTIPWSLSLNTCLGGGVEDGTWLSLSGLEKHGKTTILLCLAANAQKMGKTVYFLNVEGRFKKQNVTGAEGLDISDDKLIIIESIPGRVLSTQDYLNIAEKIIKSHPDSMIIIDSISALADDKELIGGLGTQTRGHNQQVITQFINNNAQLVSANKIIVAGIIQKMANTSGYGLSVIEKGPKRWFYQADILLTIKGVDKWRVGNPENGKIVGHILKMEARTSSLGAPYSTCDTFLRFGIGIDHTYELFNLATSCNLIAKNGSWYNLAFLENHKEFCINDEVPKFQGGENVYDYLKSNQPVFDILTKELSDFSGELVVTSSD